MSTYDSLHRQCRTLESLFDTKLTSYSRLASTITRPSVEDVEASGASERWKDLEVEVDELLYKVRGSEFWLALVPKHTFARSSGKLMTNCQLL
jgi:hypothetical protein